MGYGRSLKVNSPASNGTVIRFAHIYRTDTSTRESLKQCFEATDRVGHKGSSDLDALSTLHVLACVYHAQGWFLKAEECFLGFTKNGAHASDQTIQTLLSVVGSE